MGAYMPPLEKSVINVSRESKGILVEKINLEMFEQMSKDHPVGEIPTRNQEMLRKYEIDDEFWNIYSNAFQKVVD